MPSVDLPGGTLNYRVAGPEQARPPVVFVHGFLVNGELWTGVAEALAARGVRSYAPDLPLGSHTTALNPGADQTPRGIARMIISFLEALQLEDVTLVGNDTGGALSQFLIDTDPTRIGRLVLTNCDAFDKFPPPPFDQMFKAGRSATGLKALLTPMRATPVRHSPLGFGMLVNEPLDPVLTRRWIDPCLTDAGILRDTTSFLKGVDKKQLLDVSTRLQHFDKPVLLLWGDADRFFKLDFARRLSRIFPDARLVEIPGGRTFHPLDDPRRVAGEIEGAFYAGSSAQPALKST
ncbi:MAG: alpha/beta hydrolase [Actinomycetota bacterium]|nr:alpha/beta hydrolase [Actinomycetota bacterium]